MAADTDAQLTDPEVTRQKFQDQVTDFQSHLVTYLRRGIYCRRIEFPVVSLLFVAPHVKPAAVAFAVDIDFTNYDFEPPSVRFVDPFTGERLKAGNVRIEVWQARQNGELMNLVQGAPGQYLFLCLPGIREYHLHPAHSGDSWFLYRSRGEGTLSFVIEQLYKNSIPSINGYDMRLNIQIVGFSYDPGKLPR